MLRYIIPERGDVTDCCFVDIVPPNALNELGNGTLI